MDEFYQEMFDTLTRCRNNAATTKSKAASAGAVGHEIISIPTKDYTELQAMELELRNLVNGSLKLEDVKKKHAIENLRKSKAAVQQDDMKCANTINRIIRQSKAASTGIGINQAQMIDEFLNSKYN